MKKIATWNVNSLKVRLPQVINWLKTNDIDVLGLQELKQTNDHVDVSAFNEIGYQLNFTGQKTYNGVALASKPEAQEIVINNPLFVDEQQRIITQTIASQQGNIRIINAYCPNGQDLESDKFQYKLSWFESFKGFVKQNLEAYPHVIVMGDFNIAPEDRDVHDPSKWIGGNLVSPQERRLFSDLLELGLKDSFRLFSQEDKQFSWWDYRMMSFRRNAGLRIDHILISDSLTPYAQSCVIDKEPRRWEQPSDHTPVILTLDV